MGYVMMTSPVSRHVRGAFGALPKSVLVQQAQCVLNTHVSQSFGPSACFEVLNKLGSVGRATKRVSLRDARPPGLRPKRSARCSIRRCESAGNVCRGADSRPA